MISPLRSLRGVASTGLLATTLTFSLGGVADASSRAGERTFQQTFPDASALCARVAANTESKRLKRAAPQVTLDCSTLQSAFTAAQSAVLGVRAAVAPVIAADRAAVTAACPPPPATHPGCSRTQRVEGAAIESLRHQMRSAALSYYRTIELARRRFWSEIRALPGGRHIREDAPIPDLSS